jgi:hypothetical protein
MSSNTLCRPTYIYESCAVNIRLRQHILQCSQFDDVEDGRCICVVWWYFIHPVA